MGGCWDAKVDPRGQPLCKMPDINEVRTDKNQEMHGYLVKEDFLLIRCFLMHTNHFDTNIHTPVGAFVHFSITSLGDRVLLANYIQQVETSRIPLRFPGEANDGDA